MSILLALNCQFMQSSVFAMHFLGGCWLCWCSFRACTTTFYYNTTLTFVGATHRFYAIKIIRYYVFYVSFLFFSLFKRNIFRKKRMLLLKRTRITFVIIFFLFLHHSQFLLSFFFVVVVIIIIIIVAIHLWADETSVRIKSNPWDVLLLLLLRCCSVALCFAYFIPFFFVSIIC